MDRVRNSRRPLTGVRVFDLGRHANGLCVSLARELGATVVRRNCRYFNDPTNKARLRKTIRAADFLLDDRGPGYLERYGLGYRHVKDLNPSITYVSISDYGMNGPRSNWKADVLTLAALSGQIALSGPKRDLPAAPRGGTIEGPAQLFVLMSILARRWGSHRGAAAKHVDISRLEAAAAVTDRGLVAALNGLSPHIRGVNDGGYRYYPCRDGWVMVYLGRYRDCVADWMAAEYADRLSVVMGQTAKAGRLKRSHVSVWEIDDWLKERNAADVFNKAQLLRLPWAWVSSTKGLLENPQHLARGFGQSRTLPWKSIQISKGNDSETSVRAELKGSRPLAGIRILDFSWVLAGPYTSRILADAGAEIIKVHSRVVSGTLGDTGAPYYQTWNRNKRGITLNLSKPEGIQLARLLISKCDVVMESFSPRVMRNWGMNPVDMCLTQPGLVWLSMSAFGSTGPWRDYVAFAQTTQALSGLTGLNNDRNGIPRGVGFSFADHISGIMGSIALMGALETRHHSGRGQWIDFSQFEAISMLLIGEKDRRGMNDERSHNLFPCAGTDRWCAVSLGSDADWRTFQRVLRIPRTACTSDGPRGEKSRSIRGNSPGDIGAHTRRWDCLRLAETLQAAGIAAGPVQNASDLIMDKQLKARRCFPLVKGIRYDKLLTGLWGCELGDFRPAPALGQDNFEVFRSVLGMKDKDIQGHIDSRVIW